MVADVEDRNDCWMCPWSGAHFDPCESIPAIPRTSMPVRATRWVSSVPYILDMDASAFGTSPLLCIHATLYDIQRDTSVSTYPLRELAPDVRVLAQRLSVVLRLAGVLGQGLESAAGGGGVSDA